MSSWLPYLVLLYACFQASTSRPQWALAMATFFVPMTQALPSPLGPLSAPANIVVLALVFAWRGVRAERPWIGPAPLRWRILLMAAFILAGYLHRVYLERSLGLMYLQPLGEVTGYAKEWVMSYVAYFLALRLAARAEDRLLAWMAALACGAAEGLLAIYERALGIGRATAHLAEPNRAGAFFACASLMLLAAALMLRGRLRWLACGGMVLGLGGLFASLSRGAMLAAGVGILVILAGFYFFVREAAGKLGVAVVVVLVGINASLLLPARVQDRIMETFGGRSAEAREAGTGEGLDQSADERVVLWSAAIRMMQDRPFGVGFYCFSVEVSPYLTRYQDMAKVAHNIYLQVGAELGVPALVALVLLILGIITEAWRAFRRAREPEDVALTLGVLGAWSGLAVAVFFVNPLFAFNLSGQLWILLAIAIRAGWDAEAAAEAGTPGRAG